MKGDLRKDFTFDKVSSHSEVHLNLFFFSSRQQRKGKPRYWHLIDVGRDFHRNDFLTLIWTGLDASFRQHEPEEFSILNFEGALGEN